MVNQQAIAELEQHPVFQQERLTPEELDNVVKMISRSLDVRMVPGDTFEYMPEKKIFVYNRPQLLAMHPKQGPGLAFHNVGHALFSGMRQKLKTVSETIARNVNRQAGHEVIGAGVVPELINAAEDERMEKLVRQEWPNLDNTFLPRHDQDYRREYFEKRQKYLAKPTNPGDMVEDGKGGQKSAYWDRAAVALRGLVSGALGKSDLPKDMPWDDQLCRDIEALGDAPTCDDMIDRFESILQRIAAYREEPPPMGGGSGKQKQKGGQGQQQPQGGAGQQQSQGGQQQQGQQPGQQPHQGQQGQGDQPHQHGGNQPCKHNHPDKDTCKAIAGEVQESNNQMSPGQNFINMDEGGLQAGFEQTPPKKEFVGPSWAMVRSTVSNLIGPLKKTLDRFFKDNEVADKQNGLRSGRFNGRAYMRSTFGNTGQTNYFSRRNIQGQKSYAVKLLIDMSGSMGEHLPDGGDFIEVFGMEEGSWFERLVHAKREGGYSAGAREKGKRYQLAARLTVALTEALTRFKEVKVAIASYTNSNGAGGYDLLKPFHRPLSSDTKQHCMNDLCQTRGGTVICGALKKTYREFKEVQAQSKMLVILTDGELGDGGGVREELDHLKKAGVETVVLTVGYPADTARKFVGREYADEVTDVTLGPTLAKHLKRLVG